VLATLPANASPAAEAAAKSFAESMLAPLAEGPDLDRLLLSQNGQKTDLFEVVAERLPAVNRSASFAPQFLEAIFNVAAPGVVPGPVRTQFGWHAIAVTEIVPREVTPFATASVTLRRELTAARREQRIKDLVAGLRLQNRVVVPDNIGETLALMPL
jgi:peptidyl-prolyl cis-trans isomerase C